MANHGYITSKKHFKEEQVLEDLKEINKRRFKNLLSIEDSAYGDKGAWFISYQDKGWDYPRGFNIWIRSARKLEHRHSRNWGFYLEMIFSEELGAKYNGTMSDGGFSGTWKPEPEIYVSYRSWLEIRYEHIKDSDSELYNNLISMEMKYAPKKLKDC
jgi:hypothetical protein